LVHRKFRDAVKNAAVKSINEKRASDQVNKTKL
jgi:hypothetical protein